MINQRLLGHKKEVTDGKRIWYIAELTGFIMEIDLSTNYLRCLWRIPDFSCVCSYRVLFYHAEKLYIFPYSQGKIYVYNLTTSEYEEVKIEGCLEIMGCVKREQYIYAFGWNSTIIKYNIDDNTVISLDMRSKLNGIKEIPSKWFWTDYFIENNCIYITVQNSNLVVLIDINDNVSSMYLGNSPEEWILQHVVGNGGDFHVMYGKGEANAVKTYIAEFDANGNLSTECCVKDRFSYHTYPAINAVFINGKWLTLPFGRNHVLLEDIESSEVLYEIENGTDFLSAIMPGMFWCSVWINEYTLCSINQAIGSIILIDVNDFKVEHRELKFEGISEYQIYDFFKTAVKSNVVMGEVGESMDLKHYINFLLFMR